MAKKSIERFNFREDLTSIDYQKIMIEQNQTIIQLLSLQHQDLFHAGVNSVVFKMYQDSLKPYLDLIKKNKKNPEELTGSKKAQYLNIKRRKEDGENVDDTIKSLGLEDYFEE